MKELVAPEVEKNALFLDPLRIKYDYRVLSWFHYDKREKGVFEMFLRKLPQNRLFDGSWAGSDDTISAAFSI